MTNPSATRRVTRGGAESVLEAFGGAGRIIRRQGVVQFGTPADVELKASIRPLSDPDLPFNGRHYCAEDWHVIVLAEIDGGDHSFSEQDAINSLGGITLTFTLDGTALPTTRTAIKRFLNPEQAGLQVAYYFQQGKLMSPNELSVGSHSLSVTEVEPAGEWQDTITFFIDPAGEGACL